MAAAAKLLRRLHEQRGLRTGVMGGVTSQATQMRIDVLLADLRFMAMPAAGENYLRLHARIALDPVWITARIHVLGSWSVAAFTPAGRGTFVFECLDVGRLRKTAVGIFVTSLAHLDADVFGGLGVLSRWRALGEQPRACWGGGKSSCQTKDREPAKKQKCHKNVRAPTRAGAKPSVSSDAESTRAPHADAGRAQVRRIARGRRRCGDPGSADLRRAGTPRDARGGNSAALCA